MSEKIHALAEGGWIAGVGNRMDILASVWWFDRGTPVGEKPSFRNEDSAFFHIDKDGLCWHYGSDLRCDNQPWPAKVAMGSGGELAWGAMHHGASAIEALKIAIRFDTGSGYPIQWLRVGSRERGKVYECPGCDATP